MTTSLHPTTGPAQHSFGVTPAVAAAFLIAHLPLGLAMRAFPAISTLHALIVLALGLAWAVAGNEDRIAVWAGYVAVSDVLWRMTSASVLWEFAKYVLVVVLALAIGRSGRFRRAGLPAVYLGLLLPSSLLVVWNLGPQLAFNPLSFNLSGPLALALSVWFYSRLMLSASTYISILVAMAAPTISAWAIALSGTFSATELAFGDASSFATSGGFGPNQVSSILGLGALASLFLLLAARGAGWFRVVLLALVVGLASQSALTFSRGGLYTASGAVVAAVPFLLRERATRRRIVFGGAMAVGLALFLVFPRLESFTGGALGARFEDMRTSGRDEIAMADLEMWKENPVLGVGPGMGPASRLALLGWAPSAHTEWTRLVGEHGAFGFGAVICLLAMGYRAVRRGRPGIERALRAGMVMWAFLFMFHAGMRLAAPAFAMGLAQCRVSRRRFAPEAGEPFSPAPQIAEDRADR